MSIVNDRALLAAAALKVRGLLDQDTWRVAHFATGVVPVDYVAL